jgi:hypothetical protein
MQQHGACHCDTPQRAEKTARGGEPDAVRPSSTRWSSRPRPHIRACSPHPSFGRQMWSRAEQSVIRDRPYRSPISSSAGSSSARRTRYRSCRSRDRLPPADWKPGVRHPRASRCVRASSPSCAQQALPPCGQAGARVAERRSTADRTRSGQRGEAPHPPLWSRVLVAPGLHCATPCRGSRFADGSWSRDRLHACCI